MAITTNSLPHDDYQAYNFPGSYRLYSNSSSGIGQLSTTHKACSTLSHNGLDYEQLEYHQLLVYISRLSDNNFYVYIHLETVTSQSDSCASISRFQRIFISLVQGQLSFQQCHRFIAVECTFCKAR